MAASSERDDLRTYLSHDSDLDSHTNLLIKKLKSESLPNAGRYEWLGVIGRGNYSSVFKLKYKKMNIMYAAKDLSQIIEERSGLSNLCRETSIMMKLKHENIIAFIELIHEKDRLYMVMEFCKTNLCDLIENTTLLPQSEIKCLMVMLLKGLLYLHEHCIMHRDINPTNLLLNSSGILKIADFGTARVCNKIGTPVTPGIGTRWYQAPEQLLIFRSYTTAVDMWSAGCIFAELLLRKPLFPGNSDLEQISLIIKLFGTPNETLMPGLSTSTLLNDYDLEECQQSMFNEVFQNITTSAQALIRKLLDYDFAKRATAADALSDQYFQNEPLSCDPISLTVHL